MAKSVMNQELERNRPFPLVYMKNPLSLHCYVAAAKNDNCQALYKNVSKGLMGCNKLQAYEPFFLTF